jgi:tetratricopeptide (TPR) repeat protein/TolB-like protein
MAEGASVLEIVMQGPEPLSGTIAGRFVITERLGKGGMGEVYRAEDLRLKRTVALKRLAPALGADPIYRHRFQEEAERVSAFSDSHVASVYDVVDQRDEMILVMEYVEGQTLRSRLRQAISLEEFFGIASQCAEALIAAHDRGFVHCDIKPENIMLTPAGQVKILDFGLAKHLPRSDNSSTIDRAGVVSGTPAYMSPEVLLAQVPDGRADIFSLGVVFYEMLTGQHPFLANSFVATTDRVRHETPAAVTIFNADAPKSLDLLVHKAMAKDPGQRYAKARDLLKDLRTVEAGMMPSGLVPLPAPKARLGARMNRLARSAGMMGAAAVLAVLGWKWQGESPSVAGPVQLAILPFAPNATDPNAKAFSDGLTETVAAKLTQLTGSYPLQVVPTSEVRTEGVTSAEQARRSFGVNLVLEGSIHESEDQVRVTYSLVDTNSLRVVNAGAMDGPVTDAFAIEDRVVDGVVSMLGLRIQSNDRVVLAAHGTTDPTAYDQFLRGRGYMLDYQKPENIDSAIASFNRALSLDPKYAQAYAALGEAYWHGYHEGQHPAEWMDKARSACQQAVALGPKLADGYACLGRVAQGMGEYENAVADFQKATALDATSDSAYRGLADAYQKLNKPADAEATYKKAISLRPQYWAGYSWLGVFYWQQGRYADAAKMFQEVTTLSPDNYRGYYDLGGIYYLQGKYPESVRASEKAVSLRPTVEAYNNLGTTYFAMRKFDDAARGFERGLSLDKSSWLGWGNLGDAYYWAPGKRLQSETAYREAVRLADDRLRVNARDGRVLAYRATYLGMLGHKDEADASLQKALSAAPGDPDVQFRAAILYNHFDEIDRTFTSLQKAMRLGVTPGMVRDTPDFDHFQTDARFKTLVSTGK